jgi:hypothetical protein
MKDERIADLTVSQLQALIKKTVQEAVAEVLVEFSIAAELEAEIEVQAEMTDFLRSQLREHPSLGEGLFSPPEPAAEAELDD